MKWESDAFVQLKTPPKLTFITSSQSLGLHVVDQDVLGDPGVVDEDVEAAQLVDGLLDHRLGLLVVGDVARDRGGLAALFLDRGHDLFGLGLAGSVVDADRGALGGERLGHGAADAPGAARNERNLAFELHPREPPELVLTLTLKPGDSHSGRESSQPGRQALGSRAMEASGTAGAGAPEKLRLKIVSGNAAGDTVEVGEEEFIIGRQAEGAGSLANDIEISRTHARITADSEGRFVIEDLGSTNGTYVNGRRIEKPLALEVGDRIEVGASTLVVQVGSIQPTPAASETIAPPSRSAEPATEAAPEPAEAPDEPAEAAPAEVEAAVAEAPAADASAAAPDVPPPFSLRIEVDTAAGKARWRWTRTPTR